MLEKYKPIGFFDSGIGGISVLKEALKILPNENFIYFGDSKNAPYGTRETKEIERLTLSCIDYLLKKGCKAIVIACNTATSAAIEVLRRKYKDKIIVGIEPAIKPALLISKNSKIGVMATKATLNQKKFNDLVLNMPNAEIIKIECSGLVELIEEMKINEIKKYIKDKIKNYDVDTLVLGCTHYPLIKNIIKESAGDMFVVDGGRGTAKNLKNRLKKQNLLNENGAGNIEITNSSGRAELINLSYKLLNENN